jgi:DNA-binding NtrC family response regulator
MMIVGQSPAIQETLRTADLVAALDVTLLITGEIGVGKEHLARHVHEQSSRKKFLSVNCAALPEKLVESMLFGHKKGAFPEATENHKGYIAEAEGGTLFLDDISALSLDVQTKLLRFLETGEIQVLGHTKSSTHDVRVIAASHQDLFALSQAGEFQEDLFYRLNIVPIHLPTLRDRMGDISIMIDTFMRDFVKKYHIAPPTISSTAMKTLKDYSWPGNVRELRNFCERMLILLKGQPLDVSNLPREMTQKRSVTFQLPASGINLEAVEVELIEQAINSAQGNKSKAARLLGLTRDTFLYRLKKYGISG